MSVHSIVCIKSVVNTTPKGGTRRTPSNSELNPFDRPALEAALRIRATMDGSITALSMGPAVGAEALAEARAMGVDRTILVSDRSLAESDTLVTSRVLATAIEKIGSFDFVFFGTRTADSDTGQVGPQTASLLDIPFLGGVHQMEKRDDGWEVQKTMDAWEEDWQVLPPAAVAIEPRAFTPRPVGLVGISRVYDRIDLQRWTLSDLKLKADSVGLAGSPTRVAALKRIRHDRSCEMLEGEPDQQVAALIEKLTLSGNIW